MVLGGRGGDNKKDSTRSRERSNESRENGDTQSVKGNDFFSSSTINTQSVPLQACSGCVFFFFFDGVL